MIVTQKLKFIFGRVENIVRKVENAGYQHALLFLQCFQKLSLTHSLIHHFETVPNSKKLQTTTEMWLSNGFKKQIP